jgi:hypothetical protein
MTVRYPKDIDLIGVNLNKREVLLVECSEKVGTTKAKKLRNRFKMHEKKLKIPRGYRVRKCVACRQGAEEQLKNNGFEILTTKAMTQKLLSYAAEKYRGEPTMWLLRTLQADGLIQAGEE